MLSLMSVMMSSNLSSTAIYPLLMLISWNMTTSCLAVTGGGSIVKSSATVYANPAGFWAHYNIVILTYLLTYLPSPNSWHLPDILH